MIIGFFELAFLASDREAELHKQLRNVLDTIAFAVLLFSVVKSAQLTIEDPQIVNKITLLHFLVFMSDFVSAWFKSYSIYLAGERKHQATNAFENLVTAVWDKRFGRIIAGLLAEGFFLYEFVDLNIGTFLQLASLEGLKDATAEGDTKLTDIKDLKDLMQWHGCQFCSDYLLTILLAAMAYRVVVAVIQLKQGMTRIICLDVEEISAKREQAKPQKAK